MQDIQSIGGGAGGGGGGARLFGGVGGGGDRRLRPHSHHLQNSQALKCPRCDSLNTKFCYYNNYNLSQPRHFCKGCRRYWTKGGVLRNVPVGGGCRKPKRSKPKQPASSLPPETAAAESQQRHTQHDHQPHDNNNENNKSANSDQSSSSSSSLTATNTTAEAVSSKSTAPTKNSSMFSANPSFEQGIYEEYPEIGNLTGLIPTSTSENMALGLENMMNQQTAPVQAEAEKGLWEGGFDRMATARGGESGGGFGRLDWEGSGEEGLFEIPETVEESYWSQDQWCGEDHHSGLYLP